MGEHVVDRVVKLMTQRKIHVVDSKVLILGLSFKENCPDIRNTRVVDLVRELKKFTRTSTCTIRGYTPARQSRSTDCTWSTRFPRSHYDAIVIAVAHDQFEKMGIDAIRKLGKSECVIFDVKHLFPEAMHHCSTLSASK